MPQQMIWFFVSIAFSFIAWGIVTARYIWPELSFRPRVEALRPPARPAQLPLHRVGSAGSGRRVTRSAAYFRAFRGLWGHHCGDTCVVFAAITAQHGRRCRRMDFQPLGYSRTPKRFLPGQSVPTFGRAVGSHILSSNSDRAAAPNYARTRFPDSSATSASTRTSRKPAPGVIGQTVRSYGGSK